MSAEPCRESPFHGPRRLWSLRDMINLKLKTFDLVMQFVRRRETAYQVYSVTPPPANQGLFGLINTAATPVNALSPARPNHGAVSAEHRTDQIENLQIVEHLAAQLELEGTADRISGF